MPVSGTLYKKALDEADRLKEELQDLRYDLKNAEESVKSLSVQLKTLTDATKAEGAVRVEVLWFALEMEKVLQYHDVTKAESWKAEELLDLDAKLAEASFKYLTARSEDRGSRALRHIANYAMMCAWLIREESDGRR